MSGHTEGPFSVRKSMAGSGIWHITSDAKQDIAAVRSLDDAILFSAAPELLEALINAVQALEDCQGDKMRDKYPLTLADAYAAIAKATGETT